MASRSKKLFSRIVSWFGIFVFFLAAGMLWWHLRDYSLMDIWHAIRSIPITHLAAAAVACLAAYIVLAMYDYLALRYVDMHRRVSWWKWMLAGLLGFAISNNAGHAIVSGGAIRYRLYTRWRIRTGDLVKMLTFSSFTFMLGTMGVFIIGYFSAPRELFAHSVGMSVGIHTVFMLCVMAVGAYFAMTIFFRKKHLHVFKLDFKIPTTGAAFVQLLLGMADSILAGLVLYCCLSSVVHIHFMTFIGIFVVAQTTGILSQVPGGIGVFETIFMLAMPDSVSAASVFGALLAFRVIYYVLPLIGAGTLFGVYEHIWSTRVKGWMREAAERAKERVQNMSQNLQNLPLPKIQLPKKKKGEKK